MNDAMNGGGLLCMIGCFLILSMIFVLVRNCIRARVF